MEVKDLKKSLSVSREACKRHMHELDAHRKTLAMELQRLEQDYEKAKALFDELEAGLAALVRFDSDN